MFEKMKDWVNIQAQDTENKLTEKISNAVRSSLEVKKIKTGIMIFLGLEITQTILLTGILIVKLCK